MTGSIHYGAQAPGNARQAGSLTLESGALSDEFHLFSVEWELTQVGCRGAVQGAAAGRQPLRGAAPPPSAPMRVLGAAAAAPSSTPATPPSAPHPPSTAHPCAPGQIRWYIDGAHYHTAYSSQGGTVPGGWWTAGADAGPNSPFDSPFYLIL